MITNKDDFDSATLSDQEAVKEAMAKEMREKRPDFKLIKACERWLLGFTFFKNNREFP